MRASFGMGLMQGAMQGLQMYSALKGLQNQSEIDATREQGMKDANEQRQSAINGMISENAPMSAQQQGIDENVAQSYAVGDQGQQAQDQNTMKPVVNGLPTDVPTYSVNGKQFGTKEEATAEATKSAPSTLDFFMKNAVPKIQEKYLQQGDPEKANAWGEWAKQRKSQNLMLDWAGMKRESDLGNMEKASDYAFKLYKNYDDGHSPVSKEVVKNDAGEAIGFNVKLRNDSTGEETMQYIDNKKIVDLGLAGLSPDKIFELSWTKQANKEKAVDAEAMRQRERKEKLSDTLTVEKYKGDREQNKIDAQSAAKLDEIRLTKALESSNIGKKEQAKISSQVQVLKDNGYSDDEIKDMIPAMVGASTHKKTTDPAERRAIIVSDLMKADPFFSDKPKEEQEKKVQALMSLSEGSKAKPAQQQNNTPNSNDEVVVSKAPMKYDPSLPLVKNKKNGKMYHVIDGKYVPVSPFSMGLGK